MNESNQAFSKQPKRKANQHPFIALDHRIVDSPAFADLKPMSVVVLIAICRQSNKDNNGHLQATFSWCHAYGVGSEHTLQSAIADLLAHGFIYRTRSHGANKAWARYALTWLPVTKRDGIFMGGFVPNAWQKWQPGEKKSSPQKVQDRSGKKCSFTHEHPAESAGNRPAKTADYESCCHVMGVSQDSSEHFRREVLPKLIGFEGQSIKPVNRRLIHERPSNDQSVLRPEF
ncbi:hypothetical protein [Herbaspirillum frisingense]|uniref:hypothetical protein n=1 Tax=Herbaspirillum frisingense TaxID=92645 RepID=UPI001F2ECAAC|nr:hypothetical protein [Herbaspirillum frisingense]UIN20793.1 hypothetical protein LAZ82_20340 [Herbaspirillum frisingense]